MADLIVEVQQGKLQGKAKTSALKQKPYYSFKKIPYAKPPVGELRFTVPQPPESWEGVRDATQDSPACPQFDYESKTFFGEEDCLYLNVYTPRLPAAGEPPLPVMFYVHGGGFIFGHGTDDCTLGPDYLIEKDVVVVYINYRLGILGFLSLDCKEAPGNMGLRDQAQALKWVQQNIKQFNGDPNNVTIFGTSAGGASIEYLLLSPTAKGLFHKAIAQCGSSLCAWGQTTKMKELLDCMLTLSGKSVSNNADLLKYLKSLPIKDLVQFAMQALLQKQSPTGIHFGFVPVIEKPGDWEPYIDHNTYDSLVKGEFTKVPFMAGFATYEGMLGMMLAPNKFQAVATQKTFLQCFPFEYNDKDSKQLEDELQKIYLKPETLVEADSHALNYFTDIFILGGVYTATTLIAKNNKYPVYLYEFNYDGSLNEVKSKMNIKHKGACHADDLGYIFRFQTLNQNPSEVDKLVIERLTTLFSNFAKYGNPTPTTDAVVTTTWPPVGDKMTTLLITDQLTLKDDVYPDRTKFFELQLKTKQGLSLF